MMLTPVLVSGLVSVDDLLKQLNQYKYQKETDVYNLHAAERLVHSTNKQLTDGFRQHTATEIINNEISLRKCVTTTTVKIRL